MESRRVMSVILVSCVQMDSDRQLPSFTEHFVSSHHVCLFPLPGRLSEVAFGSVAMGFLKMQWPPSTGATCHGVVGRPSSCHDGSSRDIQYLVVSMVKERRQLEWLCLGND